MSVPAEVSAVERRERAGVLEDPVPDTADRALRSVHRVDHVWIPMRDGVRLAARLWLPEDCESDPVPAILEYIPYRKNDATAPRDTEMHPYLAARGFACARVDLRGSGDSEGVLEGEYLQQELDDGVEVIAWLASQPWCSGRVGMIGKSWGGFNGLQIAALAAAGARMCRQRVLDRRPLRGRHPLHGRLRLRRGLALVGDDDARLHGAAPRPGSRRNGLARALARAARRLPPVRARVAGPPAARRVLASRLGRRRPRRDRSATSRWSAGSPIPTAARCCGCWRPRRTASEGCSALGPRLPARRSAGPAIGFLQRCVSVFDRHLRDGDGDDEPALRAFMPERVEPGSEPDVRPGRWVAEASLAARRPASVAALARPRNPAGRRRRRARAGARRNARARRRRRDVARLGRPRRLGRRPARRGRALSRLRLATAGASAPRSSASPSSWSPSFRAARRASSSHACATSRPAARRRSSRSASST